MRMHLTRSFRVLTALCMAYGFCLVPMASAQKGTEQEKFLEALKKGKLKVTDDMIESQRMQHPELRGKTNAEIKEAIEAQTVDTLDPKVQIPKRDTAEKSAREKVPPAAGSSRFPAGLVRFGFDFFSNNTNAGVSGGSPALPEYILAPGDEIQIYTWGRENQNTTGVIDHEGMFHYPPLQPMRLSGMRFADAQQLLTREIEKINGLKASIGLGKLKSIRVFVLGEAVNPGSYVVPAGSTVTSALFQSGGIREIGSLRGIQLKRNGKLMATLDLYEMLLKGNNRPDEQLLPGDVIFVPVAPIQTAITGMVKRPGIYEVRPGTKVLDALELAGGLSSNAFKGRIRLDRIELHKRKVVLDVGMEKMAGNANLVLQDGDLLNVEEVLAREYDVVYLEGNVNRPGRYEFKKGMGIRDLIPGVKDLKTETFFTYGHIKRSSEDEQRSILLPFSLKDVFENGVSVPLMPRDTVIVYSRYDIMDQPEVKIGGVIRRPGSYPFVDKMHVSDLIIAGGGLTTKAHLAEAHLFRALKSQESDSLFSTLIKINLANLIDNPGDENNIELKPSDSLVIFPRSNFVLPKSVSVFGAVKKEGGYELSQNMGIPELLSQAEGLTKSTFKLTVEVVRRSVVDDSVAKRDVYRLNLKDILEGRKPFPLQDGDAVYIRDLIDNNRFVIVTMIGEFNFPGRYEASKTERMSSLIRRAGGFTSSSYLRATVFTRRTVRMRQIAAIDELDRRLESQMHNMMTQATNEKDRAGIQVAIEQRKDLLEAIRKSPNLGRVVVHLDKDFKFEGGDEDIVMEDGDSIMVGAIGSTISIMGEVFSPTNVIVTSSSNSIGECLDKAGGVNEYGDAKNVYYLQPDGTVITPKNTSFFRMRGVEPGGSIVVPPKGPRKDYLDQLAKITQIIYQIAISVGVAKTLF